MFRLMATLHTWYCRLGLLLLTLSWQSQAAVVQLSGSIPGWPRDVAWAVNDWRTVAAGVIDKKLNILQKSNQTWQLTEFISPPDTSVQGFGGLALSNDGRFLAVAANSMQLPAATDSPQQAILGYYYRIVPNSQHGIKYSLAHRFSLDINPQPVMASTAMLASPKIDMSADGRTVVACYTLTAANGSKHSSTPEATGGAAVFTWRGFSTQTPQVNILPIPPGSKGFGKACKASHDGSRVLVLDAARGALVYRLEAHGRNAVHRAAGWLPGGSPREQYRVTAAALSPSGQQAVLRVKNGVYHGAQGGEELQGGGVGQTILKVFAADSLGRWSHACDIPGGHEEGPLDILPSATGINVMSTSQDESVMYAVGLEGVTVTHCPDQPVMRATPGSVPPELLAQTAAKKSAGAPGAPIRTGKLQVGRAVVTFSSS